MAPNRYYSSTATATTLSSACTNVAIVISVVSVTGFPTQFPYTLILDRGTASEEAVSVTAAAGTTLTATRGIDGTSAVDHSVDATVEHGVTAQDFSEPQAHIAATTAVHGVIGDLVGETDVQTLSAKTLVQPNIGDFTLAQHDHSAANKGGKIPQASSHQSPDTDTATTSLHHTIGVSATQAAAGNHTHSELTGAWTSYIPTIVGISIGNGTVAFKRQQIGKTCWIKGHITFGTTTSVTGDIKVPFPTAAAAQDAGWQVGYATMRDNSAAIYYYGVLHQNTTASAPIRNSTAGGGGADWDNTGIPIAAWGTGDEIWVDLCVELA